MAWKVILFLVNLFLVCLVYCAPSMVFQNKTLKEGSPCFSDDGSEGFCGRECVRQAYLTKSLKICGFDEAGVIACCRNKNQVSQIPKIYPNLVKACRRRRVNPRQKREHAPEREETEPTVRIAVPPDSNDLYAALDEFPHASALGWTSFDGTTEWNCGGSLIHPEYVMTAAHCITNMQAPPNTIRISARDLTNTVAPEGRNFTIKKVHLHPEYKPDLHYNDIAILKLSKRYDGPVACIWPKAEVPQGLTAIGYGAPDFGRAPRNKLLKAQISVLGTEDCSKHYEGDKSLPNGLVESQICAKDPEGKMDTCQGDSGGPLQFSDKFVVGIISFGKACSSGIPGVYTRISSYLDWIEEVIRS